MTDVGAGEFSGTLEKEDNDGGDEVKDGSMSPNRP